MSMFELPRAAVLSVCGIVNPKHMCEGCSHFVCKIVLAL